MRQKNLDQPNVKVVSNFLDFGEEGRVVGLAGDIVHVYNKNENAVQVFKKLERERQIQRETERDRDSETERQRLRDRKTERQRLRDRETETQRQRGRETERQRERDKDRERERETKRKRERKKTLIFNCFFRILTTSRSCNPDTTSSCSGTASATSTCATALRVRRLF